MSSDAKMPLHIAEARAQAVLHMIAPLCEKSLIAGSIRRRVAHCGDLDFVVLPKVGVTSDDLIRPLSAGVQVFAKGVQNIRLKTLLTDTGIDIFVARREEADLLEKIPGNWATLVVCRTGSRQHNIRICKAAEDLDLRWDPYKGLFTSDGELLHIGSEEELFELVDLPYLKPEDRR